MIGRDDCNQIQACSEFLPHYKLADYLRYPSFASAFLSAKRQTCREIVIPVVYEDNQPVDFGRPFNWKPGTAERVLRRELKVEIVRFQGFDEEDECLDDAEASSFQFVHNQSLGARRVQEDRYICQEALDGMSYVSFFGVYDGHGGSETAEFLCQNLHVNFVKALRSGRRPHRNRLAQALRVAFRRTDEALLAHLRALENQDGKGLEESSGAAAAVVVLQGKKMVVAHVGDCRAVLCRQRSAGDGSGGGSGGGDGAMFECLELTSDHKYSNLEERSRVQLRGGCWEHKRLNSILEVSRAFGDFDFLAGCKHRGLSADPEIREMTLSGDDEFLVLASDGLWSNEPPPPPRPNGHAWVGRGFHSSKDVVRYVRRMLRNNGNNASKTLESVVEEAVRCDESDNTTAILITFKQLDQEERAACLSLRQAPQEADACIPRARRQEPQEAVKEIRFSKERPRFTNTSRSRP